MAGFGGIILGLAIAACNAHFRLGLRDHHGRWRLAPTWCWAPPWPCPMPQSAGFIPSLESLRTLLLGVVFSWKDMLTVGVPVGTAGGVLIVPFLSSLITAVAAAC